MDSALKLIAVWMGTSPPPSTLPLSAYQLPLSCPAPSNYLYALYGNRNAYLAMGELMHYAQQHGLYISTATVTVELNSQRKVGVMHIGDLENGDDHDFVNLSRVSKAVIANVANLYKPLYTKSEAVATITAMAMAEADEEETEAVINSHTLEQIDWRRPFRFMPDHLEKLPEVFDMLRCKVLIHPVRFTCTPEQKFHYIAAVPKGCVQIVSATPNRHEVGVHPNTIILDN